MYVLDVYTTESMCKIWKSNASRPWRIMSRSGDKYTLQDEWTNYDGPRISG